jgi:glycerol-3-phosphate dehydrogenase
MRAPEFDVAIIGGGINGVGVAQAAAAAGYRVALFEKTDLAGGTSSKSSKLIHGGLRYLESFEFGLVRESLQERRLLLRLAPDLVRMRRFFIPVYANMRRGPWLIGAGLSLYSLLGGLREQTNFRLVPRTEWDSLDGLVTKGLRTIFQYQDAQTDDRELARAVWQSASQFDTRLFSPARVTRVRLGDEASRIEYREAEQIYSIDTRIIVNAAGPWVNQVLESVQPEQAPREIHLVQGSHVEVSGTVCRGIYYVEAPRDGRAIFVMPWHDRTLVGTTEKRFKGNADRVRATTAERTYLLRVLRRYFPRYADAALLDAWAGLRVLPAGKGHAFHRSRETVLQTDRRPRPRMLSIYGGKLTSYRATADKVMALIRDSLPPRKALADTAELNLHPVE